MLFHRAKIALFCGLICAAMGLTYSIATVQSRSADAAPRGGGVTPLKFANPLVANSSDRDLGDAIFGSSLTRYVRARGGFRPYIFSSTNLRTFLPTLTLAPGGALNGPFIAGMLATNLPTPWRFDATVTDGLGAAPNSVTEKFRLTLLNTSAFKFAQSALSDGQSFREYFDKLEVLNATGTVTFSASNVTLNGQAKTSLTDVGLLLDSATGNIYGRPLSPGIITFLATAKNAAGQSALSRDQSSTGQIITINVADNPDVTSDVVALAISIEGNTTTGGADSIDFEALARAYAANLTSLTGASVTLQIGGYTSPSATFAAGKGGGNGGKVSTPTITALVEDKGLIRIVDRGESFGKNGTIVTAADLASSTKTLPVILRVGSLQATEILTFDVKQSKGKFKLSYKRGTNDQSGAFTLLAVLGKDSKAGDGDAWKAAFLASPPKGQFSGNAATATLSIGAKTLPSIAVTSKSTKVGNSGKSTVKLGVDGKSGKGAVITGDLLSADTKIPVAGKSANTPSTFTMGLALNDSTGKLVFGGSDTAPIFPVKSSWISGAKSGTPPTPPQPPQQLPLGMEKVQFVIVIYQENWSFDGLYARFPGASGVVPGTSISLVTTNGNGALPSVIPPINNNVSPEVFDSQFKNFNTAVKTYDLIQAGLQPSSITGDIVHRFLTEQGQIDGGKMDKFVALSDNPGLVLSQFDATNLPEGKLAQQYVMCDNFFHAAFGGSFLNHQWLIAAQTPVFPNAPSSLINPTTGHTMNGNDGFDANGNPTPSAGLLGEAHNLDRAVTNDGFAVNTLFTVNKPHPSVPSNQLVPNLTNKHIGDLLDAQGIPWAWYSGGWNDALAGNPNKLFQFHHQPFAFYADLADGTTAKAIHLRDETQFFTDLTNRTLPSVVFIKPLGPDNEHPGYTNVQQGQNHVQSLVQAVQNSAYWKNCAIIVTYDEHGGRFDHVPPPSATNKIGPFDRWGPGVRVPAIIISPYSKKAFVDHTVYDTTSILKFIETRWGLPNLSSRDAAVNNLTNSFDFTQTP